MEARNTRWNSFPEVARHLGVARDALNRWSVSRRTPACRLGRFWRFQPSEVAARVKPGSEDTFRCAGSNHSLIESSKQVP